jgi:anti-sigma-K factor RskA/putative zinc finger protein
MMKHEDYQEMLTAHALGGLDQTERVLIEEHLTGCAKCQSELDEWRGTAGAVAYVAQPMEPSPQLRARILEDVRAERSAKARTVVELVPASRPAVWWLPRFAAIAASLILVALLALVLVVWQQNRAAKAELARLTAEAEQARKDREQDQKLLELLSSTTGRVVQLTGTTQASAAHAYLVYDAKSGRAVLRARGLPQTAPGKAYQLWFIAGGAPVPGRVFKVAATGEGTSSDQIPTQVLPTAVFAITEESETGASAPTGPILLKSTT